MRARSWMAALALLGVTSILIGRGFSAQGPNPSQTSPPKNSDEARPQTEAPKPSDSQYARIRLNLVIAGLGQEGCMVEVKPANPGCKFRAPAPLRVSSEGRTEIELKDVEIRSAEQTCTVAITVREPGQSSKTIYRGFRMANRPASAAKSASAPIPTFTCYLSSRLAAVDDAKARK